MVVMHKKICTHLKLNLDIETQIEASGLQVVPN